MRSHFSALRAVGGALLVAAAFAASSRAQVSNDECTSPIAIANGTNGPFTSVNATTSSPVWLCGAGSNDVWFTYVPSCTGVATFDTCGSGFDTVLEVFDICGSCPNFANGVCNDDFCSSQSSVSVAATQGNLIHLRVGGFKGSTGTFSVNVACSVSGPMLPDDECAGATPVQHGLNAGFDNVNYTSSSPGWACGLAGNDRWFVFVPTCTGNHLIQTCGNQTNFDTTIEVLSGACGCGMTSLACNDDACLLASAVTVPLVRNQSYYIRVGGYLGSRGRFDLEILGGGNGAFQLSSAGCGGTTLLATGSPNIGGFVSYALDPVSGSSQYVWAGLAPLNLPLCAGGCSLGCTLDAVFATATLAVPIPCLSVLVGAQVYVQGADFGALGGCAANAPFPLPLTTSDTIQTTIGS